MKSLSRGAEQAPHERPLSTQDGVAQLATRALEHGLRLAHNFLLNLNALGHFVLPQISQKGELGRGSGNIKEPAYPAMACAPSTGAIRPDVIRRAYQHATSQTAWPSSGGPGKPNSSSTWSNRSRASPYSLREMPASFCYD